MIFRLLRGCGISALERRLGLHESRRAYRKDAAASNFPPIERLEAEEREITITLKPEAPLN